MTTRRRNKKPAAPTPWETLLTLIAVYAQAAVNESWKGGGDPAEFEIHELRLKLAAAELNSHIQQMKRDHE